MATILITGAGSGFGEGVALGLAAAGHYVIATTHTWPEVTALRQRIEGVAAKNIRAEKLDVTDELDRKHALKWDFDILFNNAGQGEGGPIAEIPVELLRRNFETNVFGPLALTQQVVRKWVKAKKPGKVVFTSSIAGLFSPRVIGPYAATKHAVEAIAETMQEELRPFNIQVQTINPGPYLTGFNETMVESAFRWLDEEENFTTRAMIEADASALIGRPEGRLDPAEMIGRMIEVVPKKEGKFRNVFPPEYDTFIRKYTSEMYDKEV